MQRVSSIVLRPIDDVLPKETERLTGDILTLSENLRTVEQHEYVKRLEAIEELTRELAVDAIDLRSGEKAAVQRRLKLLYSHIGIPEQCDDRKIFNNMLQIRESIQDTIDGLNDDAPVALNTGSYIDEIELLRLSVQQEGNRHAS